MKPPAAEDPMSIRQPLDAHAPGELPPDSAPPPTANAIAVAETAVALSDPTGALAPPSVPNASTRPRTTPKRLAFLALRTAAFVYVAVCLFMYFYQYRLIYIPYQEITRTPAALHLDYEDLTLRTDDGLAINAWYIPHASPRGALILCHGNAGNMEHRLAIAHAFHGMDLAVLMFDYRGYGRSQGSPDEAGTYADAEAAWACATGDLGFSPDRVILYGESLGGAVAVELARRHRPAALITEASFTRLPDIGADLYPLLPVRLLARVHYDSIDKIAGVACPKLLLHSPDDELVPFAMAEKLLAAAAAPKRLVRTHGGHNDDGFTQLPEYLAEVRSFVFEVLPNLAVNP
jgi:fermentation-respiration switch protein FrsA (DUF1100 family)